MHGDKQETLKRIKTCFLVAQQTPVVNRLPPLSAFGPPFLAKPADCGFFSQEIMSLDALPKRPLRLLHWNVNSLHAKLDRKEFTDYFASGDFDIVCFNETKYSFDKFKRTNAAAFPLWSGEYNQYWAFSTARKGYSGVAVLSRTKALSATAGFGDSALDCEGRLLTVEFDALFVVAVYAPCSGLDYKRIEERADWDSRFLRHVESLKRRKTVIVLGDLNVAYSELDVFSTLKARDFPGFYPSERKAFNDLLSNDWVDCWRRQHGFARQYSWWDAKTFGKQRGEGWRLDYCLVPAGAAGRVASVELRPDICASDHCPLEVVFNNSLTAD